MKPIASKSWNERYASEEFKPLYSQLGQFAQEHDRGSGDLNQVHEMYTGWLNSGMKHSTLASRCSNIVNHLSGMVDKSKGPDEDRHELWPSINVYKKLKAYHGNRSGSFNPSNLGE